MTATYKPTDADGIIRQHIEQSRCGHVSADGRSVCRSLAGHDGPHGEHMFVRDQPAPDFTPTSADEAQSFLAHARKDFRSEANELGYVPVQPCDLERMSLTILALLAAARQGEEDTARTSAFRAGVDWALAFTQQTLPGAPVDAAVAEYAARAASQPEEVSRG